MISITTTVSLRMTFEKNGSGNADRWRKNTIIQRLSFNIWYYKNNKKQPSVIEVLITKYLLIALIAFGTIIFCEKFFLFAFREIEKAWAQQNKVLYEHHSILNNLEQSIIYKSKGKITFSNLKGIKVLRHIQSFSKNGKEEDILDFKGLEIYNSEKKSNNDESSSDF